MEVYVVMRVILTRYGDRVTIPLEAYSTRVEADKDCAQWNRTGKELMPCRLIRVGDKGAVDSGMDAQDFLMSLGIKEVRHLVMPRSLNHRFVDPDEVKIDA